MLFVEFLNLWLSLLQPPLPTLTFPCLTLLSIHCCGMNGGVEPYGTPQGRTTCTGGCGDRLTGSAKKVAELLFSGPAARGV